MDRFEWTNAALDSEESLILQQTGVRIYDGESKTPFDYGNLSLTTHRLLWRDHRDPTCKLALPLSLVVFIEEQPSGFAKSAKILVHLNAPGPGKSPGPVTSSSNNYIKLSFRESGEREFFRCFTEALKRKRWAHSRPPAPKGAVQGRRAGPGIVGIERSIQRKQQATDKNISQAFEDLNNLIEKAKEMVNLSKTIATKIKEHQGDITEDETVKFKSYLLSMGIPDPVTRVTHGTGAKYYSELAREVSSVLETPLKDCGGIMTLTDAYCRLNRARGMELLSPEDLLNACEMLDILKTPVRLRLFDSGVMVLQLQTHSEEQVIKETKTLVEEKGSVTAEELSSVIGLSVVLARERLLSTEKAGGVCRDETVEGLRFYPNLFLSRAA